MKSISNQLSIGFLLAYILSGSWGLQAQENAFPFHSLQRITSKDGLSHNSAFALMQDHRGFIWIATNYGLNRYDGYTFKVYNYNPDDSNSISPDWHRSLFEDKNGIIWVSSRSLGFFSFDPEKEKFTRYRRQPGNMNSLSGEIFDGNMMMDASGIIWICTTAGLNSFDPAKNKFESFTHHDNDSTSISSDNIRWLCTDDENNVWILTSADNLDVFNTSSKKVIAHYSIGTPPLSGDKEWPFLASVTKGENGNIWISSESNGLYNYNTHSKSWRHFTVEPGNRYSLKSNRISNCFEDKYGNLLITKWEGGLFYYEAATGRFSSDNASDHFNCLVKDRSGKVWLTGGNRGVYTMDPVNKKINAVTKETNKSIVSDFIIGFYRSRKGELFINANNGVYIYDTKSNTLKPFKLIDKGEDIFDGNSTWLITEDKNDLLWFCTFNGLVSFNPKTRKYNWYQHDDRDSTSLSSKSATGLVIDKNGNFWVGTAGGGLNLFNPSTGKFKSFKAGGGLNDLHSNFFHGGFMHSSGLIYFGTWYGGLVQFDPYKTIFRSYLHDPQNPHSLSCDNTWPFYEDKNGIIWIGTIGGGLNAFDPATENFKTFTMKDGLPSNAIVSMALDDMGKAWLGTYHGISCCTLPQNPFDDNCKIQFRNYNMNDGLPSDESWYLGAHNGKNGTIFFPTNAGFYYFNPNDFRDNAYVPQVYITGFSLMNKQVSILDSISVLKSPIEFTREIFLTYRQNILSFTFAALNFIHPENNKYAYMLQGYDKDWLFTDASKRFATYTNLDPGEYVFKVKGSNNDEVWNETPAEIKIIITPPFWQTAWFRIIAVMAVVMAVYSFYRYRIGQLLLLQRIRNKIAADLHDDIGSTLNSISVFSEVAKKDTARRNYALEMIGESSRKILDSMSDIVWSINPENDKFDKIIFRMRSFVHTLLNAKMIDCTFRADDSLNELKIPMEIRRNFYLIFKEAINNLVKYSNAKRASIFISHNNRSVSFIIRDDGIGFDKSLRYNGNGLKNMKKRADEIKARLEIESVVGQGTSIELNMKI